MSSSKITLHKMYSEDALEMNGILFEPQEKTDAIVIHIHGKDGHFIQNHFVTELGESFSQNNVAFLTFNNRGHDYVADMLSKTPNGFEFVMRGSAFDILSECPRDINGVVEYCIGLGYTKIFLQGHSLGPHKICYYMSHNPKYKIAGCIFLSVSDLKYLFKAYVPEWLLNRSVAESMVKAGRGSEFMPIRLWSNSLISANSYIDWTREDADSWVFNFSDEPPTCKYFSSIKEPVVVVNPENDAAVNTKQSEIEKLLSRWTTSKDFAFNLIKNAPHNFSQYEPQLSKILVKWIRQHIE